MRKNAKDLWPYVILFFLNVIIGYILFFNFKILNGMLVLGDLPAFYNFGFLNISQIQSLTLYPLMERILAYFIGSSLSQNIMYVTSWFLPSFGIYSMLREFKKDVYLNIAISIIFGTPLNPILYGNIMAGGFEWTYWLFFLFLSFKYLIREILNNEKNYKNWIISGIFYSLSLTSTYMGIIGIYLSGLYIIAFLILAIKNNYLRLSSGMFNISLFFIVSLLVSFATIFSFLSYYLHFLSNTSVVESFVIGNIKYCFQKDDIFNAIFLASWSGTLGYLTSIFWYILVFLALSGGVISFFGKDRFSEITRYFFVIYMIVSLIIILIHYNLILNIFISLKIFDLLDHDVFFKLIQIIALPILMLYFFNFIKDFKIDIYYLNKQIKFKRFKFNGKKYIVFAILIILIFSNIYYIDFTPSKMNQYLNNGLYLDYSELNEWFSENNVNGKILVLPYSYGYLNAIYGYIPKKFIWNPPLAIVTPFFNYNIVIETLSLFKQNSSYQIAQQLALQEIEYILILNTSTLTLIPRQIPYYISQSVTISKVSLENLLKNTKSFSLVIKNQKFEIWKNNLFGESYNSLYLYNYEKYTKQEKRYENIMNMTMFGRYPGYNVKYSNESIKMKINGNSSIPYTLIYYFFYYNNGIISKELINTSSNGINISNFISFEYRLNASFILENNSLLSSFILFYNTTSPKSFWSQFYYEILVNYNTSGSFNKTITIPEGTKSFNIVFYGWTKKKVNTSLTLNNISLLRISSIFSNNSYTMSNNINFLVSNGIIKNGLVLNYLLPNSSYLNVLNGSNINNIFLLNIYSIYSMNKNITIYINKYIDYTSLSNNILIFFLGWLPYKNGNVNLSVGNYSKSMNFKNQSNIFYKINLSSINYYPNSSFSLKATNITIYILGLVFISNTNKTYTTDVANINTSLGIAKVNYKDGLYSIEYPSNPFFENAPINPLLFISDISLLTLIIIMYYLTYGFRRKNNGSEWNLNSNTHEKQAK
ncbi:MAG: hypothetical protein ACP5IB_07775 [Thermoplasmata archaeon]